MTNLSLSLLEVGVLLVGAIVLGITIHFFITSRRNLKFSPHKNLKEGQQLEEWKLKYFNDVEVKDKELAELRKKLGELEENSNINIIELDEVRKQNKRLTQEIDLISRTNGNLEEKPAYIDQLRITQTTLKEHNETISQLLEQLEVAADVEERQKDIIKENEELANHIEELQKQLMEREKEITSVRNKENITREMNSMLDSAYSEFGLLQNKIQKLEAQLAQSKLMSLEHEDMKEAYYKQSQELEVLKTRAAGLTAENQQLNIQLHHAEDRMKEANFQKQQLQKRLAYLEELNNDLQVMSEANKKLEGQLKRIGELESKLNVVSDEREAAYRKPTSSL